MTELWLVDGLAPLPSPTPTPIPSPWGLPSLYSSGLQILEYMQITWGSCCKTDSGDPYLQILSVQLHEEARRLHF